MSVDGDPPAARPLWAWNGEHRELPPFGLVDAATLRRDLTAAADACEERLRLIAQEAAPPTFENSILAIDAARADLDRVRALMAHQAATMGAPEIRALDAELVPAIGARIDAAMLEPAMVERINALRASAGHAELGDEERRAVELLHERLARNGGALDAQGRARLTEINARLAAQITRFAQNITAEENEKFLLVTDEAELDGLDDAIRSAAARLAAERGHPNAWALANQRPVVWATLAAARNRDLRKRLWSMWTTRCDSEGPNDNRPVMKEILRLRQDKARLLGYPDFAHFALAGRMARTPETASALLAETWRRVLPLTERRIAEMTELAHIDGINEPIEPWDRFYYEERLRQARFGLDTSVLRPYLTIEGVTAAMFEAASRLHGIDFIPRPDVAVSHPDVVAYAVEREGALIGMLYLDVIGRPGKRVGSWVQPFQSASVLGGGTLPVCAVVSSVPPGVEGKPAGMMWSHAVALFHELGHALHGLLARTRYPSIGWIEVAWDFIELPSLLNERWIEDEALLQRRLRHAETGAPLPPELLAKAFEAARHDRVFSVTLDYLSGAAIDLALHALPDGAASDVAAVERETLSRLGMPHAIDQMMRPPHFFHLFSEAYAAGVYSYLWSDVMAADVAEVFHQAPGGLYDAETAARWRDLVLTIGASVPADEAFRRFLGRDPAPDALFRRFGMAA